MNAAFSLGDILILGPSNLASSFLSVLPEEVKEKEKYEKNGQQCFDILLTCLCIMKYWICGSCCAYHSSGGRNLKWKMSQILCFFNLPFAQMYLLCSLAIFSMPLLWPSLPTHRFWSFSIAHHLLLDLRYQQSEFLFINIFCSFQRIYTLSIPILLPIAHMGLTGYDDDHGFHL